MVDLLGEGGRRTIGARHHAVKLIPNYEITIFEEDEAVWKCVEKNVEALAELGAPGLQKVGQRQWARG